MKPPSRKFALIIILAASVAISARAGDLTRTEPHPSLSPRDVVSIQMRALQDNDRPARDRGLEITFNFASPANKRQTGPLRRFKAMVRTPAYRPMIGHRGINFAEIKITGDKARIDIVLLSADQRHLGYRFLLSRQKDSEFAGSWMTDRVTPYKVLAL